MPTAVTTSPPSFLASLSQYESYEATPVIGTIFPDRTTQLSQLVEASNADELVHDLAVLVSQRGVVFFKEQDLTVEQQKRLAQKLGELTGKPETSKLYMHPISRLDAEFGREVSVITSKTAVNKSGHLTRSRASGGWHSDNTYEQIPSDYAVLRMHTLPGIGGDTLWASGYEAYDRLSPAYQKFLEGLTATHDGSIFNEHAKKLGIEINTDRGAPENSSTEMVAVHPVIITNPVTNLKTLFINRGFTKKINELTTDESENLLEYLYRHISENHDLQVRYRWQPNDVAIWDNRVTLHTATHDFTEYREGYRVIGLGGKPYLDPNSTSRRTALNL
ncbi:taurine catabolism dioxygenase [Macrolepiota fuliginosa MF-IS2]|uniref:Taurine catabolism dioxygenase n=1 Tax=Macrolepiota fuliginosa MF-IS2 TaxID=1400762 RepID=A0A9P6C388_9AGAR|nr:taurine catabolism dioxygenase [Macrolepiota fuliginosa MF-IS2]